MKRLLFLIFIFIGLNSMASEVEVDIVPSQPVKGEIFDVKFKVTMTGNEKPYISFTPKGIEVLERVSEPEYHFEIRGGIGRAKTTKTLTYTYRMVANQGGNAYLKDILVEIGQEKLKHKNISIKILNQRKEMPQIFARAEISNDEVFLGQGVDVRYYVYSLYPILQTEIKSFPKLNGFIKRFHKPVEAEQAVRVDGKVYRRSLKYSARLYPEKTGDLTVDPLRMVLQYAGGNVSPFGNLGFGFNRFKSKSLSSPKATIKVKPLPVEGLPPSFTGLVGKHEFKLVMNKNKYLVNEAIELRLEVTGPGALEKMDAPIIFNSEALEKFDDKSDFQELGEDQGRKVFEYTYLARANVTIPERVLELGYFDEESKEYKIEEIKIPSLEIGGSGQTSVNSRVDTPANDIPQNQNLKDDRIFREIPSTQIISAPLFDKSWKSIPINWMKYLNILLTLLVFLQVTLTIVNNIEKNSEDKNLNKIYKRLVKNGANYQDLVTLIFMLRTNNEVTSDIFKIIEMSQLKEKDKEHLSYLVKKLEMNTYSQGKEKSKNKIKSSTLKNLKKEIEKGLEYMNVGRNEDESLKLDSRTS